MNVIVTGAGGFIGQYVCQNLVQKGYKVIGILGPGGRFQASESQQTLRIDLSKPHALERTIKDKPDRLVHLAAVIPPLFAGPEASQAARVNREIDENVFFACKAWAVGVVYASSTSVYGLGDGELKCESSTVRPIGPYAAGKLASEQIGQRSFPERGQSFTILRINAPYGPGQRTKTILSLFIERAIKHLPLLYHGTGSREQDFTYIGEVADAVVKAAVQGPYGVYNVSAGYPISMKHLAELVVRCIPKCTSYIGPSGEADPQEAATARYSIRKAAAELGWQPQVPLESGIQAWIGARLRESHEDQVSP